MTIRMRWLAPLALLLSLAGCGQELPAGGQRRGEVSAVMIDDPGSPSPNRALPRDGMRLSTSRALIPAGTVTVDAIVTLLTTTGGAEELVTPIGGATVDLGSTSKTQLAIDSVSAIRYATVRVTFERVQANITSGLTVGPIEITGAVSVALTPAVVVERPIELAVVENGRHEVEIDLNAEKWLVAVDPVTRTVPGAALRDAVTIEVRQ